MTSTDPITTHENYVRSVAAIVAASASADDAAKLSGIKLVFGAGEAGLRGVTYYSKWQNGEAPAAPFVEVCAFGKENDCQLAGTTIHELGHVVAGFEAGHGKGWKDACRRLGLRHCHAAGHQYRWADFAPAVRLAINALPKPNDGAPVAVLTNRFGRTVAFKPCPAGIGSHGGKSRGAGSGSRLRLFECSCVPAVKARVARDTFSATCDCCQSSFHIVAR